MCVRAYVRTYVRMCVHLYTPKWICVRAFACVRVCVRACVRVCVCACVQVERDTSLEDDNELGRNTEKSPFFNQ